ncbi:2-hydroxychromene-2-carboxylate isomerase [Bradyrhizobium sp.]|uniref:2-hydroxychromene-2-carboxylate isomerase n=1 Tax=Bradyrhizobium sp. TaxID=376 RepID=UPI001DEC6586|nr:2-hydroxychromene-2-carboxylate isomerase [Bradyrhizobium sp.]MBI5319038.1 2-hydroxychromene-2-carboxylate isomerase [Bradyrhizobium sp.]
MTRTVEFYFDFPSPYSYLAHTQLPKLAAEHGATIVYRPFRILELMTIVGNRPTTIECKNKGKYAGSDLQRWVKRYNVDFSRNPHSKSLDFAELDRGALVAIEDGRGAEYVTAVFAAIWGRPVDLSQRSVLFDLLEKAGLEASALVKRANAEATIARLDAETKAAAERGVFGAPTMFVGNQMFFGNDRLDFVAEALRSAT